MKLNDIHETNLEFDHCFSVELSTQWMDNSSSGGQSSLSWGQITLDTGRKTTLHYEGYLDALEDYQRIIELSNGN